MSGLADYEIDPDSDVPVWLQIEEIEKARAAAETSEVQDPVERAAEELNLLRFERDQLLKQTDWWAVSDRTMTAEQTAYRQALRDITENYTSLNDVVWPEKP